MKTIKKFDGVVYKRGQVVLIDGVACKYSKMVNGEQNFKRITDGKTIVIKKANTQS